MKQIFLSGFIVLTSQFCLQPGFSQNPVSADSIDHISKKVADWQLQSWATDGWPWKTTDYLYVQEEHLYYRDSHFFNQREKNAKKVFWSRGNSWVMADWFACWRTCQKAMSGAEIY